MRSPRGIRASLFAALWAAVVAPAQTFERVDLEFRHAASKTAAKYLIETMGAGVALLDFDGDGLLDIYLVNGAELADPMSADARPDKSEPEYWNRLYRNLGGWRFEDVTRQAGVAGVGYGMGAAVGDFDNDGDPDLFVSNFGPDTLFRNNGDGTFDDISSQAGIHGDSWSSGAAFVDFNRDGLLDLFVASYLDWDFGKSRPCGDFLPRRRSYCHPRFFGAVSHTLYLNDGPGGFTDATEAAGLDQHPGKGLGVALGDFDDDGWVDIFVANDSVPQQLFRNVEGRRIEEVAVRSGVAYDSDGGVYAGMGVAWDDYDRDGRADLLLNALGRQGYWLYRRSEHGFETASERSGLAAMSALTSGWGMGLVDFDNDGWRDLFVAQGHVMGDISDSDSALAYREHLLSARNLHGRFFDISERAGPVFKERFAARGAAFGDLDNDGRIDILVNVNNSQAFALKNTTSNAREHVTVHLLGAHSNRDAIGAKVTVETSDGVRQTAFRSNAGSYLSSSGDSGLHFGTGDASCCKSVVVRWPDGSAQQVRPAKTSNPIIVHQKQQ